MAINTTFTVGQVLTAAQANNLPFGLASTVTSTSTQSIGGGAFADITGLTTSITLVTGRRYLTLVTLGVTNPASATAGLLFQCLFGATVIGIQGYNQRSDAAQAGSFQGVYFFEAISGGAVTVKMQGQAFAQATTLNVSSQNHRMTIIDIGKT